MKNNFFLFFSLLFLFSCASKPLFIQESWLNNFWQLQKKYNEVNTYYLQGSLIIKEKDKTSRILYTCFGKKNSLTRVDFSTSLGQKISLWQENNSSLLAVFPYSQIAYQSDDSKKALSSLGFPLPFTLSQSVRILLGETGFLLPLSFKKKSFNQNSRLDTLNMSPDGLLNRLVYQGYIINFYKYLKIENLFIPQKIIIEKDDFKVSIYQKRVKINLQLDKIELNLPPQVKLFKLIN